MLMNAILWHHMFSYDFHNDGTAPESGGRQGQFLPRPATRKGSPKA
jgi:hypothetical protein